MKTLFEETIEIYKNSLNENFNPFEKELIDKMGEKIKLLARHRKNYVNYEVRKNELVDETRIINYFVEQGFKCESTSLGYKIGWK